MKDLKSWFGLGDSVVVVAGANGLLGRACVDALVECGAKVVALDLETLKGDWDQARVTSWAVDLTDETAVVGVFARLGAEDGGRKQWAFVNCAYPRTKNWGSLGFLNVSAADWNKNVEMHLGASFVFTRESVRFLELRGGGAIVNFGSIYGVLGPDLRIYDGTPMQNPSPYAAIKAGVESMTRYVATTYGAKGIRANTVCPGGIFNQQPESFVGHYEHRTPLRRMGTPEDIAGAVAYLVGPSARYVTGQTLLVDGGWSAW
jgi:NAD(P)-dependent dehydrogenase (short-subunit alcohol dehydrogenase family)